MRIADQTKGIFPIGVVADIIGVSPKKLRIYETVGIIKPARSDGNHRLYSTSDVELLTLVHYLVSIRKVNLPGIKVILEVVDLLPKKEKHRLFESIEQKIEQLSVSEKKVFEEQGPVGQDASLSIDQAEFPVVLEQKPATNKP